MAITLLGSSDGRIVIADPAEFAGATALTALLTILPTATLTGQELIGQWTANMGGGWLLIRDGAKLDLVVGQTTSTSTWRGRQTVDVLAGSSLARIGIRWRASDQSMEIWVNGTQVSVSVWNSWNNSPASIYDSAEALHIGRRQQEALDGLDADYSEVAAYTAYLSDSDMAAYGQGFSPDLLAQGPENRVVYLPLLNTSDLTDPWSGIAGTLTGGADADHPPMIYPAGVLGVIQGAAGSGGGNRRRRSLICGAA